MNKDYIPDCKNCGYIFQDEMENNQFECGPDYNKEGKFRVIFSDIHDEIYIKSLNGWEKEKLNLGETGKLEEYKRFLVCLNCFENLKEKNDKIVEILWNRRHVRSKNNQRKNNRINEDIDKTN